MCRWLVWGFASTAHPRGAERRFVLSFSRRAALLICVQMLDRFGTGSTAQGTQRSTFIDAFPINTRSLVRALRQSLSFQREQLRPDRVRVPIDISSSIRRSSMSCVLVHNSSSEKHSTAVQRYTTSFYVPRYTFVENTLCFLFRYIPRWPMLCLFHTRSQV